MNLYIGLYGWSIFQEIRQTIKQYISIKEYPSTIPYFSNLLSKLQLSLEMIMDIAYSDKSVSFDKKKYYVLLFEVAIFYSKLKEFYKLSQKNIGFYLSRDIYYSECIMLRENEIADKMKNLR